MQPKVLIVDDSQDFADYTCRRLRARGIRACAVYGGKEAIRLVRQEPIDLVVLDILMPGMDGLETLREIKRIAPTVQVVMLTGNGTEETAERGKTLGAMDYLLKPVEFGDLLGVIECACRDRGCQVPDDPPDAPYPANNGRTKRKPEVE